LLDTDRKVDFVVAGTQKGGTSALRSYLKGHPEICISDPDAVIAYLRSHPGIGYAEPQEGHFFDTEVHFGGRDVDYSIYHSYFRPRSTHRIFGEVTPIYMYWSPAMQRIYEYNPNMKIIIILRNPIERAYSHWNMERDRGYDTVSFWHAITEEKTRCCNALPYQHRIFSYVDRGFYVEQLKRMWNYFPRSQTLILRNEDLMKAPHIVLKKVCSFLHVSEYEKIEKKVVHARPYKSFLRYKEWKYLKNIFESEITELENLTGWNCREWLDYEHYKKSVGCNHKTSSLPIKELLSENLKSCVSVMFRKSMWQDSKTRGNNIKNMIEKK